jgi:chromosome segregation ATPase
VANKFNIATQKSSFATVLAQLHTQTAQQEKMQIEMNNIKYKLEQASKTLAQKDLLIDSLEMDLEHMIDQLVKMQHGRKQCDSKQQWMSRGLPGLNTEVNNHVVA